jgi:hypothetical protein
MAVGGLVIVSAGAAQTGDGYRLTWSSIDGGGGTSTGDGFRLRGAIGQPDPDTLVADGYVLRGGFWSPRRGDEIPTVSEWGMVVLVVSILTAGSIVLTRRRSATA